MAEFIESSKGKPMLLKNGYLFVKDKQCADKIYWKCKNFKEKCRCRAVTVNSEICKLTKEHNHAGDAANVDACKFIAKIKNEALLARESPHYIVSKAVSELPTASLPTLTKTSNIKRTIRRVRDKDRAIPSSPVHRKDLVLPAEYKRDKRGEQFLLYDSGPHENRILIFSNQLNINFLLSCEHLQADGTFKTAPLLFEQLYTFMELDLDSLVLFCMLCCLIRESKRTQHCLER